MNGYTDLKIERQYRYRTRKNKRAAYRVRTTLFMAIMIVTFVVCSNIILNVNKASGSSSKDFKEVLVGSGDTLWSIASEHKADDVDIRKAIYAISEANDISANDLHSGSTIKIPVEIME